LQSNECPPVPGWRPRRDGRLTPQPGAGAAAERARVLAETGNPTPALPFGVTLIGSAWRDEALWGVAAGLHAASGLGCGPDGHGVKPFRTKAPAQG